MRIPATAHEKLLDEYHHAVSRTERRLSPSASATRAAVLEPVSCLSHSPKKTKTNAQAVTDAKVNPRGASRMSWPISLPRQPGYQLETGSKVITKRLK